ncbi:glycoside hydrolase family 9 protein [Marinilabilia salmonicolor]|jgi:peptidoglycan/xylan/chitin deacetylase (PgdA/CDA1 family)|uniref:Peptidoglycan/xylan/chitin deacetylase (PgdA/CDA1 family) n=1 Tax=Marinilabilia salmonicolor TaxID=989 RepID=A0A2T0XLQ4_9BACT|nr:glycoside hydrolase family 9 protein [Marinilabilia salmonicolor]PRY99856.1 peptidoglycan/xylan/chitin deacetylase (PgdA/CDA1 family) [Marinilabilia salmonicolor]RCW37346.1 peptidoglycan/xylan/chitin deacetylase (PgdA/CDA1 family) [Marinilabilia salmonicolor]
MSLKRILLPVAIYCFSAGSLFAEGWIRVNQLGYIPNTTKVAVMIADDTVSPESFQVKALKSGEVVFSGTPRTEDGSVWGMKAAFRLNFSELTQPGSYFIESSGFRSPEFRIDQNVYEGAADFLLNYMRQQRCGYNPFLEDSCHVHDGTIVDHPEKSGAYIDVHGGWHDASDYLQYTNTSANAVFQMLFAYEKNPEAFKDVYGANGNKGPNGRPDVLDEAIWGLEWLMRMNPAPGEMYNQIADDRDHAGYRLPNKDSVDYNVPFGRPVYYVTGERQGLGPHLNRTTGVASTAGKFASAFALASKVLKEENPEWAAEMLQKAKEAMRFGEQFPGAAQTACYVSPYFYEEQNYVDDMELGASALAFSENDSLDKWLKAGDFWGEVEPVTPWIELHGARHYQFYPFVNVGHYLMASQGNEHFKKKYTDFMRKGLLALEKEAASDPFRIGVPFIWCSNNLVTAALTQARLYHEVSGDQQFLEMEAALRDWLFGCNPWGTAMICGFPGVADSPTHPHSAFPLLLQKNTIGGLVDGPVYKTIFESLRGVGLLDDDEYGAFQNGKAVYHDDIGDYSTNEPTMDGTASLVCYLSSMETYNTPELDRDSQGAVVRVNATQPLIYLVFPADEHFEGASLVLDVLDEKDVKGSFFLTGKCLKKRGNRKAIDRIVASSHYLGPHSDDHLLYADWEKRDSLLVAYEEFKIDLKKNLQSIEEKGASMENVRWFLPPYEWYNKDVVAWSRNLGMEVVSFTPGTGTNADYTTPGMANYKTSRELLDQLWRFEEKNGLNGALLLVHPGVHPDRKDKFYNYIGDIIDELRNRGYRFEKL